MDVANPGSMKNMNRDFNLQHIEMFHKNCKREVPEISKISV